jgi:16S rRNA processing protein RimM
VHGELRVALFEEGSDTLLDVPRVILRRAGQPDREVAVTSARPAGGAVLLTLEGIADRDAAQALSGCQLCVRRADLPELEEGEVYVADLVGCDVTDAAGRSLGRVVSTFRTAAHDVLVLHDDAARVERMLPLVTEQIVDVDPAAHRLVVDAPDGLPESPL